MGENLAPATVLAFSSKMKHQNNGSVESRFGMVPEALWQSCTKKKGVVFVFLSLWMHGKSVGNRYRCGAFPSVETQATECAMKTDDVRAARRWLEQEGWITRKDRIGMTPEFCVFADRRVGQRKSEPLPQMGPLPQIGDPPNGVTPPPPNGGSPPSPKWGNPPLPQMGDPNQIPFNQEPINQELTTRNPTRTPFIPQGGRPLENRPWQNQPSEAESLPAKAVSPNSWDNAPVLTATSNSEAPHTMTRTGPPQEALAPPTRRQRKPKAPEFEPTESAIPMALWPVRAEILAFWPAKAAGHTERAWAVLMRQLQKIQNDPEGGIEAVREQLEEGRDASDNGHPWQGIQYKNWQSFRAKPRRGGFGGQPARPKGIKDMSVEESIKAAEAEMKRRAAVRYQAAHQGAFQGLAEASGGFVDVEVVE